MSRTREPAPMPPKKNGKGSSKRKWSFTRYRLKTRSPHLSITTTDEAPVTRRPSDDTKKAKETDK